MSQSISETLAAHRADKEGGDAPLDTQEVQVGIPSSEPEASFDESGEKKVSEVEFEGDEKPSVPVAALTQQRRKYTDEVADMRREAELLKRQVAEMADFIRKGGTQPQAKPADPPKPPEFDWDDPAGWFDKRLEARMQAALAPVARHVSSLSEYQSKKFAVQAHGVEKVNAAYAAMEEASRSDASVGPDYYRIMQSGDSWDELVKWYDRREMLKEYGADPSAYEAKIEAKVLERLRSGKSAAPANSRTPRLDNLPTDLADVRSVAPRSGPGWSGPRSIKETLGR